MLHRLELVALVAISAAGLYTAESSVAGPLPGQVGLYGDPQGNSRIASIAPQADPFEVYLLAFDPPEGIKGWEAHITLPNGFALDSIQLDDPNSFNLGPLTGDPLNFIVGMGSGCNYSPVEPIRLATIRLRYFLPEYPPTVELCLEPATPSSLDPPVPLSASCTNLLMPFDLVDDDPSLSPGCVLLAYTEICPPFVPPSDTIVDLDDTSAMPGQLAEMPVTAHSRFGIVDCPVEPQPLTQIDLSFDWDDPTLATLEGVQATGPLVNWSASILSSGAGSASIRLSSATATVLDFVDPREVARLQFRLGTSEGTTLVDATELRVFGLPGQTEYPVLLVGGGIATLTSGPPVQIEASSMGSLKARFDGSQ